MLASRTLLTGHHHALRPPTFNSVRTLLTSAPRLQKALPPRRTISDHEIEEAFLKGSGPGGQKINKTNSAVQIKHLPSGLVVKCQETRSREQNRKIARRILGEKLDEMELGDRSRTAIKTESARKKKASAGKKARRKYRKLAEGVESESPEEVGDGEDVDGVRHPGGNGKGGADAQPGGAAQERSL